MPCVNDLLAEKDFRVLTIASDATVLEATRMMNRYDVGSLVVMDEARVVGMLCERDVLRRVVGEKLDPADTLVSEVMTEQVIWCTPQTPLEEVQHVMKTRRINHVPVMGPGQTMRGMVSIGDLNAYLLRDEEVTIHFMHDYICGKA